MHTLLTLCILFTSLFVSAQTPNIEWEKSLGGTQADIAGCIEQTSDGGYIVAGYAASADGDVTGSHGNGDYWIVKLSTTGTIQWQKCLGGSNTDRCLSIQQTNDGGYITSGFSRSGDGDVTNHHWGEDCWIVKLSSTGNIQWQKSLGGTESEVGYSIKQTADQGFIIAGSTFSNDGDVSGFHGMQPNRDYWVVKLDRNGIIQWQKCLGGTGDDIAYSGEQTTDGGYIIAGYTRSNDGDVTGNHGDADWWIVKLNSRGTIQWKKCLGGSDDEEAKSVQQTTDGGYIVTGYAYSRDGNVTGIHWFSDYWVVKLSSTGSLQWQRCLGGNSSDMANSIQQTNDHGYIVTGYSNSIIGDVTGNHGAADYWVAKLNSRGRLQWQKSFGGSLFDIAVCVRQTTDKGFIVAGNSSSVNGDVTGHHGAANMDDLWIVKLTAPPPKDVWLKDTPDDTGREPDPATASQSMSASPYIWIRNTRDINLNHQEQNEDAIFGSATSNWVYVKLKNDFNSVTSGSLNLYYADASSGMRWPVDWHLLSSIQVTGFAARSEKVVEYNWSALPAVGRFALVARWVSRGDPMTTPETADINANVRGNNNIIWRNITIVALN